MKKEHSAGCADCSVPSEEKICFNPKGVGAKGCPTLTQKKPLPL